MRRIEARDDDGAGYGRYRDLDDEPEERGRRRDDERPRATRGPIGQMFRLVRFLVFILPLSVMLLGSFVVDCRNRSASILPEFVRASACVREDLTGRFANFDETMRTITRAVR